MRKLCTIVLSTRSQYSLGILTELFSPFLEKIPSGTQDLNVCVSIFNQVCELAVLFSLSFIFNLPSSCLWRTKAITAKRDNLYFIFSPSRSGVLSQQCCSCPLSNTWQASTSLFSALLWAWLRSFALKCKKINKSKPACSRRKCACRILTSPLIYFFLKDEAVACESHNTHLHPLVHVCDSLCVSER